MESNNPLENGTVLREMIDRYMEEPSELRMLQLLDCLTDCQVVIPCNLRISEEDKKQFEGSKKGDKISLSSDLGFTPDNLIAPDGHRYLPIFSNVSRADQEYIKRFSVLRVYISDLMPIYDKIKGEAEGFVLDYDIGIKGGLIDLMKDFCQKKADGTFNK
jgi:hypothetical protein